MEPISFKQIDDMPMTRDDIRIGSMSALKDLDTLSRDEFIKVLHLYDLSELVHSESECRRLLIKFNIVP
jgi:hypothetical protein